MATLNQLSGTMRRCFSCLLADDRIQGDFMGYHIHDFIQAAANSVNVRTTVTVHAENFSCVVKNFIKDLKDTCYKVPAFIKNTNKYL